MLRTASVLHGMDFTRCWKHCFEIPLHVASHHLHFPYLVDVADAFIQSHSQLR